MGTSGRLISRTTLVALTLSFAASVDAAIDFVHVDGFEDVADCSTPLACPVPASGKSCISGQITSAGSGAPLRAFLNAGLVCANGAVGGPCDLALTAYDALDFAGNPGGAVSLAVAERIVDGCGRFRLNGVSPPNFGFVSIVADDVDTAAENNFHAPTATPRALGANVRVDNFNVVVARNDTVARWTQTAGAPFGAADLVDVGSVLLQFRVGMAPGAGVTVTVNGNTASSKDYYFSDAVPIERYTVAPAQLATGADGAALLAEGGLTSYSGTGGESGGCIWQTFQAASIPGVLTYVEIDCLPP